VDIHVASSQKQIQEDIGNINHVTAMIVSNASGGLGKLYLLYPDSVAKQVPTSCLSEEDQKNVLISQKENAFMDKLLFADWLLFFCQYLGELQNGPHLLIVDGHISRLNSSTLATAAAHNLHIICLPSHLTHLLQPNDAHLNSTFKREFKKMIREKTQGSISLTYALLTLYIVETLKLPCIKKSIVTSFRITGVWPVDVHRVQKLLRRENLAEESSSIVEEVLDIIEVRTSIREKKS